MHPDLGAATPEELAGLLGAAYAVAILLPPPLTPNGRGPDGAEAALWIAAGVSPGFVADWLEGEAARLRESMRAPIAPPVGP